MGINPWKFGKKTIHKSQRYSTVVELKPYPFHCHFQQIVNVFVNCELFLSYLSGIDAHKNWPKTLEKKRKTLNLFLKDIYYPFLFFSMNSTDGLADTRLQRQVFKLDFAYVLFIMLKQVFYCQKISWLQNCIWDRWQEKLCNIFCGRRHVLKLNDLYNLPSYAFSNRKMHIICRDRGS